MGRYERGHGEDIEGGRNQISRGVDSSEYALDAMAQGASEVDAQLRRTADFEAKRDAALAAQYGSGGGGGGLGTGKKKNKKKPDGEEPGGGGGGGMPSGQGGEYHGV